MATTIQKSGFQIPIENSAQRSENPQNLQGKSCQNEGELDRLLNEFYKDQEVIIENLPDGTRPSEVENFLGDFKAKNIQLNEESRQAKIMFENGKDTSEFLGEMSKQYGSESSIKVSLCSSNTLLCVAHLPHDYSDQQFKNLVDQYGTCKRCLMYKPAESGSRRWYGFIEYTQSREEVEAIQKQIDWLEVGGVSLHCDFVSPSLCYYSQLNSKCLFVDNLPQDYCDVADFREVFSRHTRPLYCQVVIKDGKPLGYGIIEYKTWQEAEQAEQSLNGHKINDTAIRITYCVPGVSAVTICTRIMSKHERSEVKNQSSLLPDPVCPSKEIVNHPLIYELSKQHPGLITKFDQCLQELQKTYVKQLTCTTEKPGLLGPAPLMPMNPLMNYNLQFGLVTLLALQLQSATPAEASWKINLMDLLWQHVESAVPEDSTSLLGDPLSAQANIILQNLMSQMTSEGENATTEEKASPQKIMEKSVSTMLQTLSRDIQGMNLNSLVNLGQLALQLNPGNSDPSGVLGSGPSNGNPPSLMSLDVGAGKYSGADGLLGAAPTNVPPNTGQNFLQNLNMYAKGQGQMQGSGGLPSLLERMNQTSGGQGSILGEPPPELKNWLINKGSGAGLSDTPSAGYDSYRTGSYKRKLEDSYASPYDQGYYEDDGYSSYTQDEEVFNQGAQTYYSYQGNRNSNDNRAFQGNKYQDMASRAAMYAAHKAYNDYACSQQYDYSGYNTSYQDESFGSGYNSMRSYDDSFGSGRGSVSDYGYKFQPNPPNFDFSNMKSPPPPAPAVGSYTTNRGNPGGSGDANTTTPQGQRRSLSQFLPAPEPSPEGDYVGQHSQGIGGHYPESYTNKRQKLDNFGRMLQY